MAKTIAQDLDSGQFRYRLFFQFQAQNEEGTNLGLNLDYGIEFHFQVENVHDFLKEDEDSIQMDATLGATLMGMAYSTARGIIFERTRGTFFDGVIIPVVDPYQALLEEPVEQTE